MTHPRNQDGFALIEVIVSAAVLAIIAVGVLAGIDGATASTARERARAVAGSLAEKDQERMRAYKFDKLATIAPARTETIDGVTYTIESKATWVTDDANATPACGDSVKQAEYLRIITTVKSAMVGSRIPAVKLESLVAPSVTYAQDHGTLAVKVVAGKVSRAAGLTVTAIRDGGGTLVEQTNAEGCALFRSAAIGNYTVRLNTAGYIDKKGNQTSEMDTTVSPNLVNVVTMPYDKSVDMTVAIKTLKPGTAFATNATRYPSKANAVSDNAAETSVLRTFTPNPAATVSSITAPKLFPFDTAYSYFTGKCAYESPTKVGSANYFTDVNPEAAVKGDPDAFQPQSVTVFQPAFNLRIRNNSVNNTPVANLDVSSNMKIFATLQKVGTDTCTDVQSQELSIRAWPGGTWGSVPTTPANLSTRNWVSQVGTDFDPGMPFGTYKICLQDTSVSPNKYWSTTYDNTKPEGKTTTVELPPTTSVKGDWNTNKTTAGC